MKKSRNRFIKNLRYICLIGVIALGLMTIVGSSGGGGDGDTSTPTVTNGTDDTVDGGDTTEDTEPNILDVPSEYNTIEEAIDAAEEGDTIKIAAGTYNEQDLKVFGGLTIEGESAESTIIRGFGNDDIIDTAYDSDTTKTIVIKKVTIENGDKGIYLFEHILELTDCIVQNNNSSGIYLSTSVATISNCEIADNSDYGIYRGTVTISDSVIKDNTKDGIYGDNATITNTIIANNTGDGIDCDNLDIDYCTIQGNSKYGIWVYGGKVTISNSVIKENTDDGVYGGTVTISNSVIKDNIGDGVYGDNGTITNTIIAKNTGDGIDCDDMDVSYCTIYGNDDGVYAYASSVTIKNSIIAMNNDNGIYDWDSSLDLSNINFYGNSDCNWEVDWTCYIGSASYEAIDSILTDPMFVDAENGDFHIQEGSPALTASDTGGEIGAYGNGGNPPD